MHRVSRPGRAIMVIGLLGIAACTSAPDAGDRAPREAERTITLAIGGDVLLGGRMNGFEPLYGAAGVLADAAPELRAADVSIVNFESVVATGGQQGIDKGQISPLYFRGRPEMLAILSEAGIDAVTTANNHSGDYGAEALLESDELLGAMGIAHPGSGVNQEAACRPAIVEAHGIRVALFSVDTTLRQFAASENEAGTCHLALDDQAAWDQTFRDEVSRTREAAHVVLFFVHWGPNFATAPIDRVRRAAHRIIGLGADAIIGSNAHRIQGLEVVDGRPVIYDLGSLLFDFNEPDDSVVWELAVSPRGVERASAFPLVAETGHTRAPLPDERERILGKLAQRSARLGADLVEGTIDLAPRERESPPFGPADVEPVTDGAPAPLSRPPAACTVASLPADVIGVSDNIGPLRIVGARVEPPALPEPAVIWVETFWTVAEPSSADYRVAARAYPSGSGLTAWGDPHQPCDWQWPSERWEPGVIYRDRFGVRPADSMLRLGGLPALLACGFCGPLDVRVGVEEGGHLIGETATIAEVRLGPPLALRIALVFLGLAVIAVPAATWYLFRRGKLGRHPRR